MELVNSWKHWQGVIDCHRSGRCWSIKELDKLSENLVRQCRQAGIKEGDNVAVLLPNTFSFPVVLIALLKMGCNPLLLSTSSTIKEIRQIADNCFVPYLIYDLHHFSPQKNLRTITKNISSITMATEQLVLASFMDTQPLNSLRSTCFGVILHPTSGTYGKSKYCFRSQAAAVAEAINYVETIEIYRDCTITVTTPLYHAFAFGFGLVSAMLTNSSIAIAPQFNPRQLLCKQKQKQFRLAAVVPPMLDSFSLLAEHKHIKEAVPEVIFSAGAPCSETTRLRFQQLTGAKVYQIYGTTETGAIATDYSSAGKLPGNGLTLKNVSVSIGNRKEYHALKEQAGEVEVRSSSMMDGYIHGKNNKKPDLFPTGDLGFVDDRGHLFLIGRSKDIVNVGGVKVDPIEVEKVLKKYSGINDATVYPGIDDTGKEFVQAAISVKNDQVNHAKLRTFCHDSLSLHKIPRKFHMVEEIPRTASGKCLKKNLPGFPKELLFTG